MIADNSKKPRGRPRVLTPEKKQTIIDCLTEGLSRCVAARYVGVSPTTIKSESERDEEFLERLREAEAACWIVTGKR